MSVMSVSVSRRESDFSPLFPPLYVILPYFLKDEDENKQGEFQIDFFSYSRIVQRERERERGGRQVYSGNAKSTLNKKNHQEFVQ